MFLRSSSSEHASDFTHLATSEMTGMVFIGLLSHMTSLETVPFSPPLISFRSFGEDKLSQIVVNQLVRTEIKYTQSAGYRQSLCAFILSQLKRCRTIHTFNVSYTDHFISNWCCVPSPSGWECTHIGSTHLIHIMKKK